jgi:hypothetical protein
VSERSLVRADLLLALENAGAVTPTELHLPDALPQERYEAVGAMLAQLGSSVRWWVGDWLAYGEAHFGALAAQLSEVMAMSPEGRLEFVRVALAIPPSRRRPTLTWSHHRAVAARWLSPDQRERLLDAAENMRLTNRELEAQVRHLRDLVEAGEAVEVEAAANPSREGERASERLADCEALVDEALADLREALLDCGSDPALRVTVEVTSGTVSYRASLGEEAA